MDLRYLSVARTARALHLLSINIGLAVSCCSSGGSARPCIYRACAVGTTLKSVAFHAENKRAYFTVPSPACC